MLTLEELAEREGKGRIAGIMLRVALDEGISLEAVKDQLLDKFAEEFRGKVRKSAFPKARRNLRETLDIAWLEMHSVAHMWAAVGEFPEIFPAGIVAFPDGYSATGAAPILRKSEEFLDRMQARPDLRHPDPWCCSNDMRRTLGLPAR